MSIFLDAMQHGRNHVIINFGVMSHSALYDAMLEDGSFTEDGAHDIITMIQSTFRVILAKRLPGWVVVGLETFELRGPLVNENIYAALMEVSNLTMEHVDRILDTNDE